MSNTPKKTPPVPADTAAPAYSEELPKTPQERDRSLPDFTRDAAEKQKGQNPQDTGMPYDGGSFNGTNDSSRYSTPPPDKTD